MSNPIVSFDEQAIIEMYLAGVSTHHIEDVREILWGMASNLNGKAFKSVEEWRCRPLTREYPYVYVAGIYLKRSWGGSHENVAAMVAIGVNGDGYRKVIGRAEGFTESSECWRGFLSWLKSRGQIPALHGAFLPQRAGEDPEIEEAAGGGRQGRARRGRRDADVLRDAARALAAHPHQQRDRAPEQEKTPPHPRRRHVPRREVRSDAGCRPLEIRRR